MKRTRILGISAYYHDSAAALVEDGTIIAAAQEERFTRIKGDATFPHHAINYCLETAGIDEHHLDYVVFYENPVVKFERLLTTYHLTAPFSWRSFLKSFPDWLTRKLWLESEIAKEMGIKKRIHFCDHHISHAASAFFPSPFDQAAILTLDGVGEWSTATFGVGQGAQIQLLKEIRFPNSFGLLYSAFTYYTGFKINSGEYKLMGLAPYGEPKYADLIREKLIHLNPDGSIVLNQHYFNYVGGLTMTNNHFHHLFGSPPRQPESLITQKEMDIAASIQVILNDAVLTMAHYIHQQTQQENLCLAGGVALNVVAMGKLSQSGIFRQLWIQPAAGDAGGAIGAAVWMWHHQLGYPRIPTVLDGMQGSFLGPNIPDVSEPDDAVLRRLGAVWQVHTEEALQSLIAQKLAQGQVIAIARGRMEFGPRALGARSILGDARSPQMQSHLNLKIKFREGFRPFAPMVLVEDGEDYFEMKQESPYMVLAYPVKDSRRLHPKTEGLSGIERLKVPHSDIPAVTHVDYSARVQTIDRARNPFMHGVLTHFKAMTGCSVIVNTSFNVRGEPIVNNAEDAYRCFMTTEIDGLVIGDRFFDRNAQRQKPLFAKERTQWLTRFELD